MATKKRAPNPKRQALFCVIGESVFTNRAVERTWKTNQGDAEDHAVELIRKSHEPKQIAGWPTMTGTPKPPTKKLLIVKVVGVVEAADEIPVKVRDYTAKDANALLDPK